MSDYAISWELGDLKFSPEACASVAARYEAQGDKSSADCIRLGMPVDHDSHVAMLAATEALLHIQRLANTEIKS